MLEVDNVELLYRLLLDCQETALRRGDKWGLCDCIDNHGNPYPSAVLAGVLKHAVEYVNKVDGVPVVRSNTGLQADECQGHTYWALATAFDLCPDCHQPLTRR
jgi:hypothetical protein